MSPEDTFLGQLKAALGIIPVVVPLVSLVLSGIYYIGFLSIIGFENLGAIAFSDFSKSAIRWSPIVLGMSIALLIGTIVPFPGQSRIEKVQSELRSLQLDDADGLHKIQRELSDIREYYRRYTKYTNWLKNPLFIVVYICTSILIALYLYFHSDVRHLPILAIFSFLIISTPIVVFVVHTHSYTNVFYIIPAHVAIFIGVMIFAAGMNTAIDFITLTSKNMVRIYRDDKLYLFVSHIQFDYVTFAVDSERNIHQIPNSMISSIVASPICLKSRLECRNSVLTFPSEGSSQKK